MAARRKSFNDWTAQDMRDTFHITQLSTHVLGCFVIGALWQFVVLEHKTYSVSRTYDANQTDDLLGIYSALCQAKVYIEAKIK